jgi:hypothetical protein
MSPFLASLEPLSVGTDFGAPAFVGSFDDDDSTENGRGRRALKRSQRNKSSLKSAQFGSLPLSWSRTLKRSVRGKSSLKSLPAVDKSAHLYTTLAQVTESSVLSRSAKSGVYQQLNVYRI